MTEKNVKPFGLFQKKEKELSPIKPTI